MIPKLEMMPIRQVSEFYEVDVAAVRSAYMRNKAEIDADGTKVMTSKELLRLLQNEVDVKNRGRAMISVPFGNSAIEITASKLTYFSPRAVLRIGMLLRDSEVAKEVRTQLLNTFLYCTNTPTNRL